MDRNFAIFSFDSSSRYCDIEVRELEAISKTEVIIFAEEDGSSPLLEWLVQLPQKVQDKCIVKVERLPKLGHELRRPEADYLKDGIYELRIRYGSINYQIL